MIEIIGVGDIMPGGVLSGIEQGYCSDDVLEMLRGGDIRVGTLETAVGNAPTFSEEKMSRKKDVIYTLDNDLHKLKQLNIDVVSLANNHFFDLGDEGAFHAIEKLDELGIKHVGAGHKIDEASSPVVLNVDGQSIAILAFCESKEELIGWCPIAGKDKPGVNPLDEEYTIAEIAKYKQQYDYVVVLPHWGKEGQTMPTNHQYRLAQKMWDAGADLILGSHTHCVQPAYRKKGKAVVFSMGNFFFPDRLIVPPRSTYYPEEPLDMDTLPITDRYPVVTEITLKKWQKKARYGALVSCCIDGDKTIVKNHFVHLTGRNELQLWKDKYPFQGEINVASMALRSSCFPQLYLVQELKNNTKKIVKTILRSFNGNNK